MPKQTAKPARPSGLKIVIFSLIALGLVTALLLGLLEGGAIALNRAGLLAPTTQTEFRYRQPAAYANAPYFSRAFVEESMRQPGGWNTPSNTTLVIPNDFKGEWFNITNGQRITTSQPETFKHTIHLFGGSTVYNSEVPDNLTIASQLQSILNQKSPGTYKVENWGASSVKASQQLERLRTVNLQPGDMVIFYDGVNDAVQGVYAASPEGFMVKSNREKLAALGWFAYVVRAQLWLRDHSAFAAAILPAPDAKAPNHLADADKVDMLANETAIRYAETIRSAASYVQGKGAIFIHILQPNLLTKNSHTPYEQSLIAQPMLVVPGSQQAIPVAYTAMASATTALRADGIATTLDWTTLLDDLPDTYLDFCHTNHVANERIARELSKLVP